MSFDLVSYFAGLTPVGFWKFFLATGLGQLPATIIYSYAGGTLSKGAQYMMIGLIIIFVGAALVSILKKMYDSKNKDEK